MGSSSSKRLKTWRNKLGISQGKLADELGYKQSYVGNIESGRAEPSRNFLIKLQEKFGVRADFILYGQGEPTGTVEAPQPKKAIDRLLIAFCAGSVGRVYKEIGLSPPPEKIIEHILWMHDEALARARNPEDGDELEALAPILRAELKHRLFNG